MHTKVDELYDLELIEGQISAPQVLALFGVVWDGRSNISCLFHQDDTPSMTIYEDGAYCHGCHKQVSIFGLTMKLGHMGFQEAVEFLMEKRGILPETAVRKAPKEYAGPMPLNIVNYWHMQLDDERRQYLRDRLITDETINRYLIGYRGDYAAYTLPFWGGEPGESEVVSLQYRASPGSNSSRKYWWEPGRYKPCVFNQHLINDEMVVLVFGTLDGLLGAQDGLPMISASGLNTFTKPHSLEALWLRQALANARKVYVLPDATVTEHEPAMRVAMMLGGEMRYFPYDLGAKDYNDARLAGMTPQEFMERVIGA